MKGCYYDGYKKDLFEKKVIEWVMNEEGENLFFAKTLKTNTHILVLERIIFNVISAYRDLIRFPDQCPNCGRVGNDHDGECPIPVTPDGGWESRDFGIFEKGDK